MITGKDPTRIAATILYIAWLVNLETKKLLEKIIAAAANITEATIRNRKREFTEDLPLAPKIPHPGHSGAS